MKYQIIYADPPWDYSYVGKNFDRQFTKNKNGCAAVVSAHDHYDSMTNADIAALPVASISDDNCLLFIWITNPMLDIGMEIIKAWGFEFKTVAFVWEKQSLNPGFYTMSQCELCIVAKKKGGNIPKPRGARNVRQFLSEKRTVHSKKPDEIRNRIVEMFPEQDKIELFARQEFPGWDCWGNETKLDGVFNEHT